MHVFATNWASVFTVVVSNMDSDYCV